MSPLQRLVALETMVDHGRALRGVQQPRPQPDQPAGGNRKNHVRIVVVRWSCRPTARGAGRSIPSRGRYWLSGDFDHQRLERLFDHAVVLVQDHLRLADRKLVAFAAHGLDEHGEVQDAAAGDGELLGAGDRLDAQGDVLLQFAAAAARGGGGW